MQQTIIDAKEYFEGLSDEQLVELVDEFAKPTHDVTSAARKVILDVYGVENIVVLQLTYLVWPLLQVIAERMRCYSPHIEKH